MPKIIRLYYWVGFEFESRSTTLALVLLVAIRRK